MLYWVNWQAIGFDNTYNTVASIDSWDSVDVHVVITGLRFSAVGDE